MIRMRILLAVLLAVGHFWPQPDPQQIAKRFVVLDLEGPPAMTAGLTSKVAVRSSALGDAKDVSAASTKYDVMVRGRTGEALLRQQVATRSEGRTLLEIPGSALEPGARLEVAPLAAPTITKETSAGLAGEPIEAESLRESALAAALPALRPTTPASDGPIRFWPG